MANFIVISRLYHSSKSYASISLIALLTLFSLNAKAQLAGGTYTIGAAGTYPTFGAAITAMTNGISGPVLFQVQPGTYTEQVVLTGITGTSATNTITFESATGDSSGVILQFMNTFTDNYVVMLSNVHHLRWRKMTVRSLGGTNGRVFSLLNFSSNISIENCVIQTDTTLTSSNIACVFSDASNCYNVSLLNNHLIGGYRSVHYNGTQTARMNRFTAINNLIEKFYTNGLYLIYSDSLIVSDNRIFNRQTTASIFYPLQVFNTNGYGIISGNYIFSNATGSSYGLNIQKQALSTDTLFVFNNMVIQTTGTGTNYGIYLNIANYVNVYNNSVLINGGSATGGRAFYLTNLAGSTTNINIRNNNFANLGGGYAYYINNTGAVTASDYNNLYTTGNNLAYWGAAQTSLTGLQAASSKDLHSVSAPPGYVSSFDLHSTSIDLYHAGTPLASVLLDFDGEQRDTLTPCIGADEFSISQNDAGCIALEAPLAPCAGMPEPVKVQVKNWGIDTLTSFTLNWSVNAVLRNPVAFTGILLPGDTTTLILDTLTFLAANVHQLKWWTSAPNGTLDDNPANDTLEQSRQAALSGQYTIGVSVSYPYQSFSDAVNALINRGVCGPVVFEVTSGTYSEHIVIPLIHGVSALNTITFRSAALDSSAVTLSYQAASVIENYVVKLDGARFVTFERIGMAAGATSTYSRVVDLTGEASFNKISNCLLSCNATNSSNAQNIYVNVNCNRNTFTFNNLHGGYSSIHLYGISSNPQKAYSNTVTGNKISAYHYYGINALYQDSLVVHGNFITTGINNLAYGISVTYSDRSIITNNDVQLFNAGYGYCIYLTNLSSSFGQPTLLANNFITKINGSTLYSTGIYVYNSADVRVVHNSVHIADAYATSRGIYQSGGSGLRFFNNNVSVSGSGYAFYANTPAAIDSSDYNNFFSMGAKLAFWTYDQANLTDLQAASGIDVHSISHNPAFQNITDLHTTNFYLNGSALPLPYLITDIDGQTRNPQTPDIGADEFNPPSHDAGLLAFTSPASPLNAGISPVTVTLINGGFNNLTSVTIHWTINGVAQTPYNWTGNLPENGVISVTPGSYNFTAGATIKAWVASPNGQTDAFAPNDTLGKEFLLNMPPLKGVYTLGGVTADFPNFVTAVTTLKLIGIDSTVVILVNNGTYTEQVLIDSIPGISAANTVTFRSASGDSTDVVLAWNSTPAENYVLNLSGVGYVTFSHITLSATNPNAGYVVVLENGAHHNTLSHNIITTTSGSSTLCIPVWLSNQSNENYNSILNNDIRNGYYGIYTYGVGTASHETGNVFSGNRITGFYYSGIYSYYSDSITIADNYIRSSNLTTLKGIYIFNTYNALNISRNQIILNSQGQTHGIYFYTYQGLPSGGLISNNFISLQSNNNTDFGLYIGTAQYIDVYYNTIHLYGMGSASRCLFIYSQVSYLDVKNNNLVNDATGYAFYISSTRSSHYSDHNNLYTNGNNLGYYIQPITDLATWQMYTVTLDSNSVSEDPVFFSNTGYKINSLSLNGTGVSLTAIATDIEGELRDPSSPDIGCDEFTPLALDAWVVAITEPMNCYGPAGTPIQLSMFMKNLGTTTIGSMQVGYQINQDPPFILPWIGFLQPNDNANQVFNTGLLLPIGTHTLKVFVSLPGDQNPGNDTLTMTYTSLPLLNVTWADPFDGTPLIWAHEGSDGLWQRGIPAGTVLNTASSPPNVWGTQLTGQYNNFGEEYLYSPFFNFRNVQNATLEFRHWFVTHDLQDGLQVQVSVNGGNSWSNLGFYMDPNGNNWYNQIQSGMHYFSGNSNGWITSSHSLSTFNNYATPVQFRFRFFSDGNGTDEGWILDDFRITLPPVATDASLHYIAEPTGIAQTGLMQQVTVHVKNTGTTVIPSLLLHYKIDQGSTVTESYPTALAPDTEIVYTFSAPYTVPSQQHSITCRVEALLDTYSCNDSLTFPVLITPAAYDAGVTGIISPIDTVQYPFQMNVSVWIKNFGQNLINQMDIAYQIDLGTPVTETWQGYLIPGDSLLYNFNALPAPPGALYQICVYSILLNDGNPGNDKLCAVKQSWIGLESQTPSEFYLSQNRPNPAYGSTVIEIGTPLEGHATLEVISITGLKLMELDLALTPGRHLIELGTGMLPPGVYAYILTQNGIRLTRRMVISHI